MLDALPQHHLMENLAALHANEAVVQLGLAVWLQPLRIADLGVVAVEGRARDGARSGLRWGSSRLSLQRGLRGDIALGGRLALRRGGSVVGRKGGEAR